MDILNLTQHQSTPEQRMAGVTDLTGDALVELKALLTFEECPDRELLSLRAKRVAALASDFGWTTAMIGGAPYFMSQLEYELQCVRIAPLYAFSKRISIDIHLEDGSVEKQMMFKHLGFVEA